MSERENERYQLAIQEGAHPVLGRAALRRCLPGNVLELAAEFLMTRIRNNNTRLAYDRALRLWFYFLTEQDVNFCSAGPPHVAAHLEDLAGQYATPSIKLHLSAIRAFYAFL